MINTALREELIEEVNLFKGLVNDCYRAGEIGDKTRINLLQSIGAIKSILLADADFSKLYKSSGYGYGSDRKRVVVIG